MMEFLTAIHENAVLKPFKYTDKTSLSRLIERHCTKRNGVPAQMTRKQMEDELFYSEG